ncbi:MAG: sigma-54 dependent transcriptional regulator [Syntrophotaleaceae bacterium]
MSKGNILLVDDEPNAVRVLSAILEEDGFLVEKAYSAAEAKRLLQDHDLDAVITDVRMPGEDGLQLFEDICLEFPDIPVIFLTAFGSVESAVKAMTRGAFYFFVKPPDYASLKGILCRAVEQRRLKREVCLLKAQISNRHNDQGQPAFVGGSTASRKIMENVEAVKDTGSSVLICGETGTGKELIARALHFESVRKDRPFVAVNCAALPKELIESELFGYEKGAFTGAGEQRIGKVEQTAGGTLFLDEIGELDIGVQAKLLRVLQEKEFERLGGNRKIRVDFRLVASTNRDLPAEVGKGHFREDLFYRINVFCIVVPPLRERKSDISLLAHAFLREFCARENKILSLSPEVLRILEGYDWPGNVRQLRNVLERAVVLARGKEISERELPEELGARKIPLKKRASFSSLKEIEAQAVRDALENCNGNKSMAARMLGMSRKALYKRLKGGC